MDPLARKLFQPQDARQRLAQLGGILASSPQLSSAVQSFQFGGLAEAPAPPQPAGAPLRAQYAGVDFDVYPDGRIVNVLTGVPLANDPGMAALREFLLRQVDVPQNQGSQPRPQQPAYPEELPAGLGFQLLDEGGGPPVRPERPGPLRTGPPGLQNEQQGSGDPRPQQPASDLIAGSDDAARFAYLGQGGFPVAESDPDNVLSIGGGPGSGRGGRGRRARGGSGTGADAEAAGAEAAEAEAAAAEAAAAEAEDQRTAERAAADEQAAALREQFGLPAPPSAPRNRRERMDQELELVRSVFGDRTKDEARERAMNLAMIGLAIAAGQSPNALTNIAQGALSGLQAMQRAQGAAADREDALRAQAYETVTEEDKDARKFAQAMQLAEVNAGLRGAPEMRLSPQQSEYFKQLNRIYAEANDSASALWSTVQEMEAGEREPYIRERAAAEVAAVFGLRDEGIQQLLANIEEAGLMESWDVNVAAEVAEALRTGRATPEQIAAWLTSRGQSPALYGL